MILCSKGLWFDRKQENKKSTVCFEELYFNEQDIYFFWIYGTQERNPKKNL